MVPNCDSTTIDKYTKIGASQANMKCRQWRLPTSQNPGERDGAPILSDYQLAERVGVQPSRQVLRWPTPTAKAAA
jgi:hypothetical protein